MSTDSESGHVPDFAKLAAEALADVESGELTLSEAFEGHGRFMFCEGVRAAKESAVGSVEHHLDEIIDEAGG